MTVQWGHWKWQICCVNYKQIVIVNRNKESYIGNYAIILCKFLKMLIYSYIGYFSSTPPSYKY